MNGNKGGSGSSFFSNETKLHLSYVKTGKKHSKIHKNKGITLPPEFGEKISKALKGRKQSEDTRLKIYTKERNHNVSLAMLGKPKSEEHKNNLRLSRTGKPSLSIRKPTLQYDLEGNLIKEWEFAKQAAIELNLGYQMINHCLLGKAKSAFGYIWVYKN